MSAADLDEPAVEPAGPPPEPRLATRATAPTPRRLSRRVLATSVGIGALGIATAVGIALTTSHHHAGAPQQVPINNRQVSYALATAPKDYSAAQLAAVGKLAPPGPETTDAGLSQATATAKPTTGAHADGERKAALQQQQQRKESARSSKLFASEGARAAPSSTEGTAAVTTSASGAAGASSAPDAQDRKSAFVAGGGQAAPSVNAGRLQQPAGRYAVLAGSTIAAALVTGLSSDLAGQVVAQVTEDVFDSVTGRTRLIPQGTRLIGEYDARVTYGQSRALAVWTRMVLPDGRSIDLDRMVGTDPAGQSGFKDRVDSHTGRLVVGGLLSVLFGVGANAATGGGGSNGNIAQAIRESAGRTVEDAGDKIVQRDLNVQPTITIRPGARLRVLVSRDLLLAPWPASTAAQAR